MDYSTTAIAERKQAYIDWVTSLELSQDEEEKQEEKQEDKPKRGGAAALRHRYLIWARSNKRVPQSVFEDDLQKVRENHETSDMQLIWLVRLVYLDNQYDVVVQEAVENYRFWLSRCEVNHVYWSENHMLMTLSSWHLLDQKWPSHHYGTATNDYAVSTQAINVGTNNANSTRGSVEVTVLRTRYRKLIVTFLNLKRMHGFFECFSTVYADYTLQALLNLADFSNDAEIQALATMATRRLIQDCALMMTKRGGKCTVMTRGYIGNRIKTEVHSITEVTSLLMGIPARQPHEFEGVGAFMVTSKIDWSRDIDFYPSGRVSKVFETGLGVRDLKAFVKDLDREDQVMFLWSVGAYAHADVVKDTRWVLQEFHLAESHTFKVLAPVLAYVGAFLGTALPMVVRTFRPLSYGPVFDRMNVILFRNDNVMMSSFRHYNPGFMGSQQITWAVTIDNLAPSFGTGPRIKHPLDVGVDPERALKSHHVNSHLPYVDQVENVAVVCYRATKEVRAFCNSQKKLKNLNVWLYWPRGFDVEDVLETKTGTWVVGCKNNAYIGIYRHGYHTNDASVATNGVTPVTARFVNNDDDGQMWACVVGNIATHKSFDKFKHVLGQSKCDYQHHQRTFIPRKKEMIEGAFKADGKTVSISWDQRSTWLF
eukprot:m.224961 g.224961  ORF g.224961 m.224961 type:complete len:651 (-) comp33448_c0_seq1:453-2405(-)